MRQYDVLRNLGRSRREFPYFVLVQSGLLKPWERCVVVPLACEAPRGIHERIAPILAVEGRPLRFAAHLIGNVPRHVLGDVVLNLSDQAETLLNAIDLVLSRGHPY